jgi:hypothetical protein
VTGHDRSDPFYLPLEPQSEVGKAIKSGRKADAGAHPWDDDPPDPIPMPPERDLMVVPGRTRGGISDRARAATNLKVDGFSYQEIADMLEFKDAKEAKREVEHTLAMTHTADDYETLRTLAASRAEQRLRLSSQMAGAHYLVIKNADGTEEKVANERQLQWAALAATDLMNWATITGAKAPTKMEITPDLAALDTLVDRIARAAGHEDILDAEVIDMEALPATPGFHEEDE